MSEKALDYHALNAMLNLYDANGEINFDADRKAAKQYFLDHVNQNTVFFHSLSEKLEYLVEKGYYEAEVLEQYPTEFLAQIWDAAFRKKFRFRTFLGAFKYYTSYTLKTRDGKRYLERYEDRIVMTALYLARGDKDLAMRMMNEMIEGRFQPATPTFLNAGKQARGELVSCFPAGTKVDTATGQRSIEEIKVGDMVLTEDGKYNRVVALNARKFKERLLRLRIVGTPEINVTPEHPFLVRVAKGDYRPSVHEYENPNFRWIAAKDLHPLRDQVVMAAPLEMRAPKTYKLFGYTSKMDAHKNGRKPDGYVEVDGYIRYLNQDKKLAKKEVYSRSFVQVKAEVSESEEFGRFVGYYLAEGHVSVRHKSGRAAAVVFTFGSKEEDFINDVVSLSEKLFGITPLVNLNKNDNSAKISINNVFVAELMLDLCGTGYGKKYLTQEAESAPLDYIKGVLIGAARGDGCCYSGGVMLDFVNPELIHQLKLLATRIGLTPDSRYYANQKGNLTGTLRFSGTTPNNEDFIFSVAKNLQNYNGVSPYGVNRGANYALFHDIVDGKHLALVQSLVEADSAHDDLVYNIQVENNPTYSVNGIVVHNCFLLRFEDNMESIGRGINSALQLSKRGGGVALSLTNLREAGAPIKGIENQSSGVIPVMKLLEDSFSYANQLGARQGAGAVYLNAHHPDIMRFLDTKRENADEKIRIKTLSLGVVIPDITFELAKRNEDMYLFSPHDIQSVYGVPFSEISVTEKYDEMVDDKRIRKKKINAREFFQTLAEIQFESGYPYMMFEDTVNKANPIDGRITMSNLCSEILQVSEASTYHENLDYDHIGVDISCNLGSMNIARAMDGGDLGTSVETAIRALTAVSEQSNINSVPSIVRGNTEGHAIGLGQMNLHGFLARERIHYDSPEAVDFTSAYFAAVLFHALRASNAIAREKGQKFAGFERSKYADGSFFEKYVTRDWAPETETVKGLFEKFGVSAPTREDWEGLKAAVMKDGLYNRNLQAVPPTGSISYINDSTSSIHPIASKIEIRKEGKIGRVYYPAPFMTNDNLEFYKDAYEIGYEAIIDVYAAATEHVDQGLSLTLFFPDTVTTRTLNKAQIYAWKKGIKTVYYIRLRQAVLGGTEVEGCVSCSL